MHKEINKYLKLVQVEKLNKNHRECIELYNIIGGLHTDIGSYDEAFHYHEEAYKICKTIGDRSLTTVTFRFMGEAKAALGSFYQAIDYIKRYLELAENLNNKVEIQRAWTTLGRVYLMQAQELRDKSGPVVDKKTIEVAREAEKKFQRALTLAESVRDQVDGKEYAQMQSGLLMNLGLVKDICGQHPEAVIKFNRAIETCRAARIKDDLYRVQITLASIYRQRNDVKNSVKLSEDALQTAKSIGKKLIISEALIERGLARLCQRDFKNAKRTFVQAYLEKSPNEDDHLKAIKLTKLAHLIVQNYELICASETAAQDRLKSCDKLGDLFVAIGNYKLAVEFYRRAYSDAKLLQRPKQELAKILYSIAETYADDGQFKHALLCYEKELSLRESDDLNENQDKEQCQSLIKIAHMNEYLHEKDDRKIAEIYEKALDKANKQPKLIYQVLKYYVPFMKQRSFNNKRHNELEEILMNLKSYPEVVNEFGDNLEEGEEEEDLEDEVANIDDIITDDEDNDEVLMIGGRRRVAGSHQSKFKPNEVGDTPLHEASIRGDLKRVRSLINQGHDINPRDNAGWIPLHEACNHGHYEIAELLVQHGADVNNRGLRGVSPLHDAAMNGHYEIMRLLIKNGANVIALTDAGETVLSCLRDWKKRNVEEFSNREATEYRQMEAELLNNMDKCGFSLMDDNVRKNQATGVANTVSSGGHSDRVIRNDSTRVSIKSQQSDSIVNVKSNTNTRYQLDTRMQTAVPSTSSVKDYRQAIQTLKRKRVVTDDNDSSVKVQKKPQPAVSVGATGSISTKQWLAQDGHIDYDDDDSEDDAVHPIDDDYVKNDDYDNKEPNPKRTTKGSSRKGRHILIDDEDEDDDDIVLIAEKEPNPIRPAQKSPQRRQDTLSPDLLLQSPKLPSTLESVHLLDMDDGNSSLAFDEMFTQPRSGPETQTLSSLASHHYVNNNSTNDNESLHSASSLPTAATRAASFVWTRLFNDPLEIVINNQLLLVPIKDKNTTVGELKKSIVDRYHIIAQLKPEIKLTPKSRPELYLFDDDLCKDVIRESSLVAHIVSWNLDSCEQTYTNECERLSLEPLQCIRLELRKLDASINNHQTLATAASVAASSRGKITTTTTPTSSHGSVVGGGGGEGPELDWSGVRFARTHLLPVLRALTYRPLKRVNFQGFAAQLEFSGSLLVQDLFWRTCIPSWKNLTLLDLKCCGLLRSKFELLCGAFSHRCITSTATTRQSEGTRKTNPTEVCEETINCSSNTTTTKAAAERAAATTTMTTATTEELDGNGGGDGVSGVCSNELLLPELRLLDVSYNSIVYKTEEEFMEQVVKLRQLVSANLKRLDVRRNHLLFVKKKKAFSGAEQQQQEEDEEAKQQQQQIGDIEILIDDQYEDCTPYDFCGTS